MFKITVTRIEPATAETSSGSVPALVPTEIFAQVVDDLDVRKFARDINKSTRVRKAKTAKPSA